MSLQASVKDKFDWIDDDDCATYFEFRSNGRPSGSSADKQVICTDMKSYFNEQW